MVWTNPFPHSACDVECIDVDLSYLATRLGLGSPHEALRRWVQAEVKAKLTNTPILAWLKHEGLPDVPLGLHRQGTHRLFTVRWGPWIACFGTAP
ncbi:MAG: hypothetical protein AAGA48_21290 [Myxococcota bacterium]